jgi:integrase
MSLTKRDIDAQRYDPDGPPTQILWDGSLPGFGVRVFASGVKSFVLDCRANGRKRRITLGRYGVLTPDAARKKALKELGKVGDGTDPAEERRAARAGDTVKDFAELYITREVKHHKTAADTERRIRKHIIPALGARRVKDVTTPDIARLHHRIGDNTPIEANRVREILHRMFECARKWGYTDPSRINPVTDVDRFRQQSRDRFAGADELAHLWRAIDAETDPNVRVAFRLLLLTGCRKNEVITRCWRDVNLHARELRLPDTKNGKPAVVPLSDEAVEVLRELPRGVPNAPLFHVSTVKRAWNRVRARAWLYAHPDEAVRLRTLAERDVLRKHVPKTPETIEARLLKLALPFAKAGGDRLTIHDLRRSVGSLMAMHTAPTVIGKALRNPTAVAVYTRISDQDARRALEEHGKRLANIVNGQS